MSFNTENKYDLVIIGAGPAGLTAALYASRAKLKTLVIEQEKLGSLLSAHKIDNYPGYVNSPTGTELYEDMKKHAKKFGAVIETGTFLELDFMSDPKLIKTSNKHYLADSIIVATGWPKNNATKISGEEEFLGKGVSYCATCDGAFFRNMPVAVFGQGEEAAEEALFLTKHAGEVLIFTPDKEFECESSLKDALKSESKVKFYYNKDLKEISGSQFVEKVIVIDKLTGNEEEYKADGAFLYLGTKSNNEMFSTFAKLNDKGYIVTNEKMHTYAEGVYAAGDVREKELRQVVTAVSDGAIAGLEAVKYVLKKKK